MNNLFSRTSAFFSKAIRKPFKTYCRIGGSVFGITLVSNFASSLYYMKKELIENPQLMTMAILGKSSYFALLWPSFFITAITRPREVFIFGEGVTKFANEISKEISKEEKTTHIRIKF